MAPGCLIIRRSRHAAGSQPSFRQDADIQNEDEVPYRSVDANEVLSKMETAKNRLEPDRISDACRNNPFSRKFRSSSQGLAQRWMHPRARFVAFATAPGSVASDGTGKN